MPKKYLYLFVLAVIVSLLFRLLAIQNYNFAFTWDQARDLIDLRRLVFGHTPLLVGPTTGLTGVFVGPFWYYFNALPFLLSQGDPASAVIWLIASYLSAAVFIFWQYRKFFPFNLFFALLFVFASIYFHTTHYSLNPNLLPIFFLILFTILPQITTKTHPRNILFLGIFVGFGLQVEAAMAIIFLPLVLFSFFLKQQKVKQYVIFLLGLFLTLIPQIIYEFRHQFSMSKLVLNQLTGQQDYLTNPLTLSEKFIDLLNNFTTSLGFTFGLPWIIVATILVTASVFICLHLKQVSPYLRTIFLSLLAFYPLAFIFYLIYPFRIYLWYLHSLGVIYIFILSLFLYLLFQYHLWSKILTIIFLSTFLIWGGNWQLNFIKNASRQSDNPSNLSNRLSIIDWIYKEAAREGFRVYTYSPAVEDRPFHYLFWWYGTKTYRYQPSSVAIQPDSPHYLPDNDRYWTKIKSLGNQSLTFLIFEPGDHQLYSRANWLKQFQKLCLLETKDFPFQITVEKRATCD